LSDRALLANYFVIFSDDAFRKILINTFVIAAETTVAAMIIAYPITYLLVDLRPTEAAGLVLLFGLSAWIPILAKVYAWTQILGASGLISTAARALVGIGTPAEPISLMFTRAAAVIGMVHYVLPYMVLILYSGFKSIDRELMAAAASLGATEWQTFQRVFFPQSLPSAFAGALIVFIVSLGFFVTPAVLGSTHESTIAMYIQQQVDILNWGVASAMGMLLLAVTLIGYLFLARVLKVGGLLTTFAGGDKGLSLSASDGLVGWRSARLQLWFWMVLVLVFLLAPIVLVVLVSFSRSSYFTLPPAGFSLRWYRDFFAHHEWVGAAAVSIRTALATAALSTLLGLMVAIGLVRLVRRYRDALEMVVLAPVIVPSILMAIADYDLFGRFGLVGSWGALVLGHTVLAMPFTAIVLISALNRLDQDLEAAAMTMGASPVQAFIRVSLPRLVPSVLSAMALAGLISWDEVPVALFLTSEDQTLPVRMFGFLRSNLTPTVAAASAIIASPIALVAVASISSQRQRGGRVLHAPASTTN
jgi:putative spermidine/putrescine transport system permease protein